MTRVAYNIAFHTAGVLAAPFLYLWARLRRPRFREALPHRLGRTAGLPAPPPPPLWLHGVSLGEVRALAPLVKTWRHTYPDRPVLLSSTTETGLDAARTQHPDLPVTPYPLDVPWAVGRMLDYWRPACVGLLETELWPNFLWQCADRNIAVCVISGRLSARTLRRAGWARPLWRDVLAHVAVFAMQSDDDAERIARLGAPADRVTVAGNLKWDVAIAPAGIALDAAWGLTAATPLLMWGSTHEGEEALALKTWQALRCEFPGLRLCVAPRHPERFDAVANTLTVAGVSLHRRSAGAADTWDVLLLDSVGELSALYRYASLAVMGGTFVPVGGHNILEPLAAGTPVLVGPHTQHIRQLLDAARAADALVETTPAHLAAEAGRLLRDAAARDRLAGSGRALVDAHRGTAHRLVQLLDRHWPPLRCGA